MPSSLATLSHAPRTLPYPSAISVNRVAPTEETTFRVTAQALKMKLEDDRDIHFVIADLSDSTHTMIVEFPNVACDGAADSTHKDEMAQARHRLAVARSNRAVAVGVAPD